MRSIGRLVFWLTIIGVFDAAVAARCIPASPSGCSGTIAAVGATMIGYFIFSPSSSVDRSTRERSIGLPGTMSTQSNASRLRRSVNSEPSPCAV